MASMDISTIWDEPADTSSSRTPATEVHEDVHDVETQPQSKTRRSTLFLSSDSEGEGPAKDSANYSKKKKSKGQPDIDALFADLDNDTPDDPDTAFDELAPSLDLDALRRQADEKNARNIASKSNASLQNGSIDDDVGGKEGGKSKTGKDEEKAKRKTLPKLDETRLLGPDGFPALLKQAKEFKTRGKGHEVSSRQRLNTSCDRRNSTLI